MCPLGAGLDQPSFYFISVVSALDSTSVTHMNVQETKDIAK